LRAWGTRSLAEGRHAYHIPAAIFGLVEGLVSLVDEEFWWGQGSGPQGGYSNGGGNAEVLALKGEALFGDEAADAFGEEPGLLLGGLGQEHHKLFAAKTGRQVRFPQAVAQEVADSGEDHVAGQVAVAVVDGFKKVEIEHQEAEFLAMALVALDFFPQSAVKAVAVGDAGQPVMVGQGFDAVEAEGIA